MWRDLGLFFFDVNKELSIIKMEFILELDNYKNKQVVM